MPIVPMLMLMFAAPDTGPVPGPIKAFGDWVVGCDNQHRCEMTSLGPADDAEASPEYEAVSFSVAREAGPMGGFSVEVQVPDGHDGDRVSVRIDAEIIAGGVPRQSIVRLTGAAAARIVAAMVAGKDLFVTDSADTMIGRVSLTGSSASLRFIDADQGRAGTVTASVARGTRPASAVPAVGAGPVVRFVRPSGTPAAITPALRRAMDPTGECAEAYAGGDGGPPEVEAVALGGGKTLALLPCGSGAYNYSTIPFIISGGRAVRAEFDYGWWTAEDGGAPELINAGWDAATGRLSTYNKGRGIGDCGQAEDYVWDGARFRLVHAMQMPECRGSVNWLTVWRAEALPL